MILVSMRWMAELSLLTSITVRKQKWVCHGCKGHCWESNCNADIICFNNLGFPLFFTCMIETKKVKMHNFASNKMGFLLFSCIARELTKEIWHHKYELRSKRVPVKKSPDQRGQQAKPWQPLQHLLYLASALQSQQQCHMRMLKNPPQSCL